MCLRSLLIAVLSLVTIAVFAQTHISVDIPSYKNTTFYVFSYNHSQEKLVDSIVADNTGRFTFQSPANYKGVLRFRTTSQSFDVMTTEKNVSIKVQALIPKPVIIVEESAENKVFYNYIDQREKYLQKSNLLFPLIYDYPKDRTFYPAVIDEYSSVTKVYDRYLDSLVAENKNLLAVKIIQYERLPNIDPSIPESQASEMFNSNFFTYADFSDTLLLNTPQFGKKIIDYLTLYSNKYYSKTEQEDAFIEASGNLLGFTKGNPFFRTYMANYLIEGFTRFGFDTAVDFIAKNVEEGEQCEYDNIDAQVKKRIENLKNMAIGKKAPDFSSVDVHNNPVVLSQISKPYILLYFWSSTCPHCQKSIPKLQNTYKNYSDNIEFVSVSIDKENEAFEKYVASQPIPGISICDFKGWVGKLPELYNIYATPTFMVLDQNLTIVAKPTSVKELENYLDEVIK